MALNRTRSPGRRSAAGSRSALKRASGRPPDQLPAPRRDDGVHAGLVTPDADRTGRDPGPRGLAARGPQGFRQAAQERETRGEADRVDQVVPGRMLRDDLRRPQLRVLGDKPEVGTEVAAVADGDLHQLARRGRRPAAAPRGADLKEAADLVIRLLGRAGELRRVVEHGDRCVGGHDVDDPPALRGGDRPREFHDGGERRRVDPRSQRRDDRRIAEGFEVHGAMVPYCSMNEAVSNGPAIAFLSSLTIGPVWDPKV